MNAKGIIVLLVVTSLLSACGGETRKLTRCEQAVKAWGNKSYGIAYPALKQCAEKGDASAQAHLGLMYLHGQGVQKNKKTAIFWLKKSAAQGNRTAQQILDNTAY